MSAMSQVSEYKARKLHKCSWCAERIEIGEEYTRYRYFSDGDAGTVKMHPECYDAMLEAASHEGGWIEWTPGDGERPRKVKAEGEQSNG